MDATVEAVSYTHLETFEGSLPAFIAAFTQRKGISQQEAAEIRRMIDAAAGKE